ncbi:PREDICTED: protein S100-A7-like [Crocodylus porosus]|uniref:protein S100-A7-like n=1 Tax=Crocodylus porosus TaxID=8502 RepID=UPI00093EC8E4|nr:PREDICTED: protein S100-A7-like [Crocodylus porosus]
MSDEPEITHSSTAIHHHGCTLESALEVIVNLYHQYSAREGKDDFLSQKDLREFLQCQAPIFLEACNRDKPGYIDKLFRETDKNKDKKLSFEEFTKILAKLAYDTHCISHNLDRCHPGKD